jgi:hypothetical protein
VDGDWEPSPAIAKQEEDEDEECRLDAHFTHHDHAEFYNVLDSCDDQWPMFYQRPPTIVEW